ALVLLEGLQRQAHFPRAGRNDSRQLARAEADGLESVQTDERRRRVNGIHHIVERSRERVDVLAVDRGHERPVQPLADFLGQEVAFVLDLPNLVRFRSEERRVGEVRELRGWSGWW